MLNLSGYKPSDRYMLRSLHGTYYLIPTGQDIAMHHNAIKLNDTGLIIWDAITNGIPMDKLPSVIRQRFTTDGIDMSSVSDEELSDDAYTFIRSLICQSALVTAECTDSRLHSGSTDSLLTPVIRLAVLQQALSAAQTALTYLLRISGLIYQMVLLISCGDFAHLLTCRNLTDV